MGLSKAIVEEIVKIVTDTVTHDLKEEIQKNMAVLTKRMDKQEDHLDHLEAKIDAQSERLYTLFEQMSSIRGTLGVLSGKIEAMGTVQSFVQTYGLDRRSISSTGDHALA
jgi:septal ring factor EnvC (AmiA/AmiB activator)